MPPTASVTVLLYNGILLCGFNVPMKGLILALITTMHDLDTFIQIAFAVYTWDQNDLTALTFDLLLGENTQYVEATWSAGLSRN